MTAPIRANHDQHARRADRSTLNAPTHLRGTGPEHDHPCLLPAPLPSLDDAELVERAVGGRDGAPDPAAFGELYERYMPAIFAFAMRNLHDRPQAEDITSETFLRALRALPRYTDRGLPLRSWFFRITVNLINDFHRAAPALPARSLAGADEAQDGQGGAPPPDLPDPQAEAAIDACEQAQEFGHLLEGLPRAQRIVIRLRFADGLTVATIASRMGRSAGAVRLLQFRGLEHMRRRREHDVPSGLAGGDAQARLGLGRRDRHGFQHDQRAC